MGKSVLATANGDLANGLLRDLRIESSVLCRSIAGAPWGFRVDQRAAGSFHVVIEGGGWLDADGAPASIPLRRGDLVVLPRGDAHAVRDAPTSPVPRLASVLREHEVVDGELRFGGEGEVTEIVCGVFTPEGAWPPPWVRRLPAVIRSPGSGRPGSWREAVASTLRDEARRPSPGGASIVNRLLESLVAEAFRGEVVRWASDGATSEAQADRRIGPVLARIHARPGAEWTLDILAREAAMSRSAFAARFRSIVGDPPLRYVATVRLGHAARLLRATDGTVAEIARRVGYASESALSRAFKNRFGQAPSAFRRRGSER